MTFLVAVVTTTVFAQGPGLPGGDPDTPVPIDGGVIILLVAGLGYGLNKMRKEHQNPGAS